MYGMREIRINTIQNTMEFVDRFTKACQLAQLNGDSIEIKINASSIPLVVKIECANHVAYNFASGACLMYQELSQPDKLADT